MSFVVERGGEVVDVHATTDGSTRPLLDRNRSPETMRLTTNPRLLRHAGDVALACGQALPMRKTPDARGASVGGLAGHWVDLTNANVFSDTSYQACGGSSGPVRQLSTRTHSTVRVDCFDGARGR